MATTKVEYFNGSTKIGERTTEPFFEFTWENAPLGNHNIIAKHYEDGVLTSTSDAVGITVNEATSGNAEATALIDFGSESEADKLSPSPWNNFAIEGGAAGAGDIRNISLLDEDGNVFGSLSNAGNHAGSNTSGHLEGNTNGISFYAWRDSIFVDTTNSLETFTISGLDNSKTYDLEFFSSRSDVTDDRTAAFTINGVKKTLQSTNSEGTGNTDSVIFTGIAPVNGEIVFTLGLELGDYAYINILRITRNSN